MRLEQPMLFWADPEDPNEDPSALFFFSAQSGSIPGMKKALERAPELIFASDVFQGRSALHLAAASPKPAAADAVRWLLKKGIPWSAPDKAGYFAEDFAGNEESQKALREWAIQREYELHYKGEDESHPDEGKPFAILRLDKDYQNDQFCKSQILFTNPDEAPEDEVALVCVPDGTGVMMEWERPIMRETARLLLDGMPTSGLRILNIGFGIGMIDTYFQDAHPAEHVIIEGHSTCLGWMRHTGWYDRPGVRILEGRWQDFFQPPKSETDHSTLVPNPTDKSLALSSSRNKSDLDNFIPIDIGKFDIVYFDTFQEGYRGHFAFIKHVPRLLRGPGSRFSYFNGHASMHEISYKVYAEVARLHHNDLGLNTEWFEARTDKKEMWYNVRDRGKGTTQKHEYLIPLCALAPTVPRLVVPGVGWSRGSYFSQAEDVNQ